ncbi:MAG: 4-hydroxybenzoate octaprenyltransferase [Steroidobacteraceae bacterium]
MSAAAASAPSDSGVSHGAEEAAPRCCRDRRHPSTVDPASPARLFLRRARRPLARVRHPRACTVRSALLLWPVLWALWIASNGTPPLQLLVIFVAGTVLTRSAGCVINDDFHADRNFDPHVRHTRERPLAARRVSPYEALALFFALMLAAFWLVLQLDLATIKLSFVAAALAITYPFFKRFFPAPQLYLGVAFGWGVPMAFTAQLGGVPRIGWLLFVITVLWAGVYDTLYAMVDRDDDRAIGIKSTALLFGDMDRIAIGVLQLAMLWGFLMVGSSLHFGQLVPRRCRDRHCCSPGSSGSRGTSSARRASAPSSTTTTWGWRCSSACWRSTRWGAEGQGRHGCRGTQHAAPSTAASPVPAQHLRALLQHR